MSKKALFFVANHSFNQYLTNLLTGRSFEKKSENLKTEKFEQNSTRNPASSGAGQACPYQSLADMALDCLTCFSEGGVLCCSI